MKGYLFYRDRTNRHSHSVTEQHHHTTSAGHPAAGNRLSMPVEQVTPNRVTSENEVQVSGLFSQQDFIFFTDIPSGLKTKL